MGGKSGVTLAYVDFFNTVGNIIGNKLDLPNGNTENYVYDLDTNRYISLSGWEGGPSIKVDQDRAIFWDGVHPSTRTHCWIAYTWHLELFKAGKWPSPNVQGYKDMCSSTKAYNGHVVRTEL